MADYQPLLTRAVANLPSTSTVATRHAIYERARKAQLAQLGTLRPPLPESDIAREEEALDQAIALVKAKFSVTDFTSADVADCVLGRLNWAESGPTGLESGRKPSFNWKRESRPPHSARCSQGTNSLDPEPLLIPGNLSQLLSAIRPKWAASD
jgi:hypothetical protein